MRSEPQKRTLVSRPRWGKGRVPDWPRGGEGCPSGELVQDSGGARREAAPEGPGPSQLSLPPDRRREATPVGSGTQLAGFVLKIERCKVFPWGKSRTRNPFLWPTSLA